MSLFKAIALGTIAALAFAGPLASQASDEARLEASCRATEVTVPDSCPCTITRAREAGLSAPELASLFKDDGRTRPVDQAKYGAFWQVKVQCIADATMAQMNITPGNPLPGVPPHMRPGAPLGQPPEPFASVAPERDGAASPMPAGRLSAVPRETSTEARSDGVEVVTTKYTLRGSDYLFSYERELERIPQFVAEARSAAEEAVASALEYDRPSSSSSYRDSETVYWSKSGSLGRLWPVKATGSTNNRPQAQFVSAALYDADLGREIAWTDVFASSMWNGTVRNRFCEGLNAERRRRGTATSDSTCPPFDKLLVDFESRVDGSLALKFTALAYIAGSYAEGPYEISVPLTAELLAAVTPTYRDLFTVPPAREDASASAKGTDLVARLGAVRGETTGEAQCSTDLYFLPPEGRMPANVGSAFAYIRANPQRLFATQVDSALRHPDGWTLAGWKIELDGVPRVLEPVDTSGSATRFSDGTTTLGITPTGITLNDPNEPSFGFGMMRVEVSTGAASETFEALQLGVC